MLRCYQNKNMNLQVEINRLYEDENLSERQIAKKLNLAPSTIHYWRKKKTDHIEIRKSGRLRKTDEHIDLYIKNASDNNPFLSAVDIRNEIAPNVSVHTIRRRLKENGLKRYVPLRKPCLSPIHVQKRFDFATSHVGWRVKDWSKVVFSDEKIFRVSSGGRISVHRSNQNDRYDQTSTDYENGYSVCVWMAFCKNFKIIHLVEQKTLNAKYYTEVVLPLIKNELIEKDLTLMHDLPPVHTSQRVMHWLDVRNINVMEDWPPKSPDLTPIESVWAVLVRRIAGLELGSRDQLWENMFKAFGELDAPYLVNLIESMPRRIAAVLETRGNWTKY